ncbi:ankyrin-1-like [Hibiscus syriacus]|uniref:ankyrin-1-like n=1 Tax=Hibiscus syriacus TaxID=106335 RepID=UPI0019222AEF|nr:ankyrin-1-like [Hibiscus syriacus]
MDAPLYEAAERGDIEGFHNRARFELEPLRINTKGQTLLHVAARHGHSTVVKFLIEYQAGTVRCDPEQQETGEDAVRTMLRRTDHESNTALHIAVQYGHRGVVQELLEPEHPDFPYSVNGKQESPLYIASRRGDGPLLDMMLQKLKSVAHGGPHGRTALHAAAMAGDAEAARVILERRGNLTKERDEDGHTPLHYAAHLGHSCVVEELLEWDKSAAYVTDKKWEMTPLLMAARQGHGQIVTKILSVCPDCCEKVDKIGWNLLHFVALRNSPFYLSRSIFKYGIVAGQSRSVRNLVGAKDVHGITPQQVYDASPFNVFAVWKVYNNTPSKNMEEIGRLSEDIGKEVVAERPVRPIVLRNVSADRLEKARDAHLVVAALIATVTFAAAITVPGGYNSDEGEDQGTPLLIRDSAFQAFVVSNALAFVFSLCAVATHFDTLPPVSSSTRDPPSLVVAARNLYYAMVATTVAFSTGTYVVLKPFPWLAITSCIIGVSFLFPRALYALFD